ncbi:DEK C-terminal domain-containing protein [Plasmodiophora brassicae]
MPSVAQATAAAGHEVGTRQQPDDGAPAAMLGDLDGFNRWLRTQPVGSSAVDVLFLALFPLKMKDIARARSHLRAFDGFDATTHAHFQTLVTFARSKIMEMDRSHLESLCRALHVSVLSNVDKQVEDLVDRLARSFRRIAPEPSYGIVVKPDEDVAEERGMAKRVRWQEKRRTKHRRVERRLDGDSADGKPSKRRPASRIHSIEITASDDVDDAMKKARPSERIKAAETDEQVQIREGIHSFLNSQPEDQDVTMRMVKDHIRDRFSKPVAKAHRAFIEAVALEYIQSTNPA